MTEPIRYKKIIEGTTSIYVPSQPTKKRGPGKKQGLPFYNPAMEMNRDSSIAIVQWLLSNTRKKHISVLDGLAATGIRGIRFSNELSGSFDVTINDWSEKAYDVIQKNYKASSSSNITYLKRNLNRLLLEQKYDYIDVDPFGTPATFIDAAMKSIHHNGIMAVSATDTAALCGVYPKVCKRRYGAEPYHGSVMHEVGLRILLGFVAREACKHDKGIQPILTYKTDHYMRLYVQVIRNVSSANESANNIQSIPSSKIYPFNKKDDQRVGPLWIGKLHSRTIVNELKKIVSDREFGSQKELLKLLNIFEEEAQAPLFYYTTDDLASLFQCSPPKLVHLWNTFEQENLPIFKTHFNPTGFKTPAPFETVKKLFQSSCEIGN